MHDSFMPEAAEGAAVAMAPQREEAISHRKKQRNGNGMFTERIRDAQTVTNQLRFDLKTQR